MEHPSVSRFDRPQKLVDFVLESLIRSVGLDRLQAAFIVLAIPADDLAHEWREERPFAWTRHVVTRVAPILGWAVVEKGKLMARRVLH